MKKVYSIILLFIMVITFTIPKSSPMIQAKSSDAAGLATPVPPPTPLPDNPSLQAITNPIPQFGDQPLLVILVDFPDQPGIFTGQDWQQFFFGSTGFANYYTQASYNQLRYTGDIVGISDGTPVTNSATVAYVRLPSPITFYANGAYGYQVGTNFFPQNNGGVVYHALLALDAAGFDFAPYANPLTGNRVDNLVVVFAGKNYNYTQPRDPNSSLRATAYRLVWAGLNAPFTSTSGYVFDNYTFCPEQRADGTMVHIGICVHEHGHSLGMIDLYDHSGKTSGAGFFDVMAHGVYGFSDGKRPIGYGAFARTSFGWVTPMELTGKTTVTLRPSAYYPDMIKLYPNDDFTSTEYFLVENRQPVGIDQDWELNRLCPGIVIWHIDETIVQSYWARNRVNTWGSEEGPPHPGVIIAEADNATDLITPPQTTYGECDDTWKPGQTWQDYRLWNNQDSGLVVKIESTSPDGAVTLTIGTEPDLLMYLPLMQK